MLNDGQEEENIGAVEIAHAYIVLVFIQGEECVGDVEITCVCNALVVITMCASRGNEACIEGVEIAHDYIDQIL